MFPRRSTAEFGPAERSTRRLFLAAAIALALIAFAAFLVPQFVPASSRPTGAISWRPTALGAAMLVSLLLWELRGAWFAMAGWVAFIELPILATGVVAQAQNPITLTQGTHGVVVDLSVPSSQAASVSIDPSALTTFATFSQAVLTGLVIGFVGTVVLRLSRSADAAAVLRERIVSTAAAEAGANAARARAAALVHDEVLSTLNLAASPLLHDREQLARQATQARALLADASEHEPRSLPVALRDDALALDPEATFTIVGEPTDRLGDALGAITGNAPPVLRGAMRQALRNSILHAGSAAHRQVSIVFRGNSLEIVVSDDGVGFDPADISTGRLGLRTSTQAVRSVDGDVVVSSNPGAGTRVSIVWPAASMHAETAPTPAKTAPMAPPATTTIEQLTITQNLGEASLVRVGVTTTAIAFVLTQLALAALASTTATHLWAPWIVLVQLLAAAALLQHRYRGPLGRAQAAFAGCLAISATLTGLLSAPFEVGELWFAGASAFLLTALAFRGYPALAGLGGLLLSALVVTSGLSNGAPPFTLAAVSIRPFGVVCFAVGLTFAIAALLKRIAKEIAATETASTKESWEHSARTELTSQVNEVRDLVDDILSRVASGHHPSPAERAHITALEGRLRDRIRAGRLAAEPLLSSAMRARERGVDVLLLDDREGELPPDFDLAHAAAQVAAACEGATERVTARVMPAGRSSVLSLVVDGAPAALEHAHHTHTIT